jgi:hypothetical protein
MRARLSCMMTPATATQLAEILGELDTFTIERILDTHATIDEVTEARAGLEDERRFGEPREPTTARVDAVRMILRDLVDDEDEESEPRLANA